MLTVHTALKWSSKGLRDVCALSKACQAGLIKPMLCAALYKQHQSNDHEWILVMNG